MKGLSCVVLAIVCVILQMTGLCYAHNVDSVELEFLHDEEQWVLQGEMDIAYMLPETRSDPLRGALSRKAVMQASEPELARIRAETENTLRTMCKLNFAGKPVAVKFEFPDFDRQPLVLPEEDRDWALLTVRMVVRARNETGVLRIDWHGEDGTELILLDEAAGRLVSVLPKDGCDLLEAHGAAGHATSGTGETSAPVPVVKPVTAHAGGFWTWLRNGFYHVVPGGWDHMFFILGLFLLAPRWKVVAAQSLIFTLAHSTTLALSVFGLVNCQGKWLNVAIAFSIAFIGIENLFARRMGWTRAFLAFAFGLLHGLGFAGGMADKLRGLPATRLVMPLVGFNLGVELAQLAVILTAAILLWPVRKRMNEVRLVGSLVVACGGLYWMAEELMR